MSLPDNHLTKWADMSGILKELFQKKPPGVGGEKSYVGMIIHTTALNTQAKVIAEFGGTAWKQISGKFLLGASSTYSAGSTGGEATHILTEDEMPSHSHYGTLYFPYPGVDNRPNVSGSIYSGINTIMKSTTYTGNSEAHENMPPYATCYIWQRTE